MKRLFNLKNVFSFLIFSFLIFSFNFAHAGFADYNDSIKKIGYDEANKKCSQECPTDQKYYQLTTGVPFLLGSSATKCACVPVSTGMQFFLTSVLKFVLGSVGTISVIIIIVAGFRWSFSAGSKKTISDSKNMIKNAIIGLIMTLTSGLALQVINPKLLVIAPLNVKPLKIENTMGSCGYPIDSSTAKNRNIQLCRISTNNSFLNSGSNFTLEWAVCDIDGRNCGEVQKITNSDKKQDSKGQYLPICTPNNDKYGRFSVKIITASGVSSDINVECAHDNGVDSESIGKTAGAVYSLCRARDGVCIYKDSAFCAVEPNDGGCSSDSIAKTYKETGSFVNAGGDNSFLGVSKSFNFTCISKNSSYTSQDFSICDSNGTGCRDITFNCGERPASCPYIKPQFNKDMIFSIRMKSGLKNDKDFEFECDLPNGAKNGGKISKEMLRSAGPNSVYYFCLGEHGRCGLRVYNHVYWAPGSSLNIKIDAPDVDFNCGALGRNQSMCEGLKFGNFQACYWDGDSCEAYTMTSSNPNETYCTGKAIGTECPVNNGLRVPLSGGIAGKCEDGVNVGGSEKTRCVPFSCNGMPKGTPCDGFFGFGNKTEGCLDNDVCP